MFLAIDTSGEQTWVALSDGSRTLEECGVGETSHNEELAQIVERVLATSGVSDKQLQGLIVGQGPGTFTGLRIGFSFAKGLAAAYQCPLWTVCSFQALAYQHLSRFPLVAVVRDARKDEMYLGLYRQEQGLQVICKPEIVPLAELSSRVRSQLGDESECVVVTSMKPIIDGGRAAVIEPERNTASGLISVFSAQERKPTGVFGARELSTVAPKYLRSVRALTIAERRQKQAVAQSC